MNNGFYRDLISHLIQAGSEGVRVCQLARHIYNQNTTLFDRPVQYGPLRRMLNSYLWHSSRHRRSIFVQRGRGIYALKAHVAIQLDFDFADEADTHETPQVSASSAPRQLYLFDEPSLF